MTINLPAQLENIDVGFRLGDSFLAAKMISQLQSVNTQDAVVASTTQTQAGGTIIYPGFTTIGTANSSDAITLPLAQPGMWLVIVNSTGSTIQIFPFKGDKINAASKDAAVTAATVTTSIYLCTALLQWWGGAITNEG